MAIYPIARWSERFVAFMIDMFIVVIIIFTIETVAFGDTNYYGEWYGFSNQGGGYTGLSVTEFIGVPPYGPISAAAVDSPELAAVVVTANVMTGLLSLEYLVCSECSFEAVVFNLLPYAITPAYFVGMERALMTTVGRRALRLRVTGIDGQRPSSRGLLLSNFGKTFPLAIDLILGLMFARDTRQRIFSRWGGVIVVKIPKDKHHTKFELD